jgi:hypothetical protein
VTRQASGGGNGDGGGAGEARMQGAIIPREEAGAMGAEELAGDAVNQSSRPRQPAIPITGATTRICTF